MPFDAQPPDAPSRDAPSPDAVTDPPSSPADGPEPLARLCDLWEDLRGRRPLPDRADLDPADIAFALGNVALVDIEHAPLRARYRLVGIHLVELWGRELRGRYVDTVFAPPVVEEAMRAYGHVVENRAPLYTRRSFRLSFGLVGYHRLMLPFHTGAPDRVDLVAVALFPTSPTIRAVEDWWTGPGRPDER